MGLMDLATVAGHEAVGLLHLRAQALLASSVVHGDFGRNGVLEEVEHLLHQRVAAVKAADPRTAAAAAKRATSAKHAAESHALLAEGFAGAKGAPVAGRRSTSDQPVNFLVVRNGRIIATFLNEDDALLFESELADLDVAHGATNVTCEVRSRGGRRVGGYLLAGGKIVTFVEEDRGAKRSC